LRSDEGTEYVGRGTVHRKGIPRGTGGPTGSSSGRFGAAREPTRGARGDFKASRGTERPGEGARGLGRRAAWMPRAASARAAWRWRSTFRCAPVRWRFSPNFSTKVR
jgi:hypothetical protein